VCEITGHLCKERKMSETQALELLYNIVRQVPLTADQHRQAAQAADILAQALLAATPKAD
jgi:hypothetical protein